MIDCNAVRFLLGCRRSGVNFSSCITLGSQELSFSEAGLAEASQLSRNEKVPVPDLKTSRDLFTFLGAETFNEMDFSDYEGADVLHDLNSPVGDQLSEKYSVVYDGGSLEHIFNISEALRSSMRMVKLGGHLIMQNPSNNWFGHGFYQLSPEFYFRALAEENGFQIVRIVIHDNTGLWYEIKDPNEVRQRTELIGVDRLFTLVCARRIAIKPIFESWPAQSDYSDLWNKGDRRIESRNIFRKLVARMKQHTPPAFLRFVRRHFGYFYRAYSLSNKKIFTKVKDF